MSEANLTKFQVNSEKEIAGIVERAGLAIDLREILSGTITFYSEELQTGIHLVISNGLEIWLFGDEANLSHAGSESRFESPDFDSVFELQAALLNDVRSRTSAAK